MSFQRPVVRTKFDAGNTREPGSRYGSEASDFSARAVCENDFHQRDV